MEIDPEVAELLGDLPPITLPIELEAAGWGHNTMNQMIQYGQAPPRAPTEGAQAPTYDDVCVQCGRPVTLYRQEWTDHSGKQWCDRALAEREDSYSDHHVTAEEVDVVRKTWAWKKWQEYKQDLPKQKGPCSTTKYSIACAHRCEHEDDHFGFHECKYCRHIWK